MEASSPMREIRHSTWGSLSLRENNSPGVSKLIAEGDKGVDNARTSFTAMVIDERVLIALGEIDFGERVETCELEYVESITSPSPLVSVLPVADSILSCFTGDDKFLKPLGLLDEQSNITFQDSR